jgi:ATP-binding cassette subfamily B protein
MPGISDAAETIGFRTGGAKLSLEQLKDEIPLPCILHWKQNHFVVLYKIKTRRSASSQYHIADPASRKVVFNEEEFKRCRISGKTGEKDTGAALLLEPGPEFFDMEDEKEKRNRGLLFFFRYLMPYKNQFAQLILGMITVSLLQLITPFLTQSLVDTGIRDNNLSFIAMILIAQLVIFLVPLLVSLITATLIAVQVFLTTRQNPAEAIKSD